MCFSAGASFSASAVLAVTGILCVRKAEKRSQILFAAIPFIFSIQQFTEGFVWLSLTNTFYIPFHNIAVYIFLLLAQVVWPIWVPLSILSLTKDVRRKRIMWVLTATGIAVSLTLGYYLFNYSVGAEIISCHIHYIQIFPMSGFRFSGIFYFIPTIVPLFIPGIKRTWSLGVATLISLVVAEVFYSEYAISIWCFFAAIISLLVLYIVGKFRQGIDGVEKETA